METADKTGDTLILEKCTVCSSHDPGYVDEIK